MAEVFLAVDGIGYGGFSGGLLHMMVGSDASARWRYWKIRCQGTGGSKFITKDFFKASNLLFYLDNRVINIEMSDSFLFSGTSQIKLDLFSGSGENEKEPLCSSHHLVDFTGGSMGGVKITTRVTEKHVYLSATRDEAMEYALGQYTLSRQLG